MARLQRFTCQLEPEPPYEFALRQDVRRYLRLFRRYYSEQRPLPFLMIETWNDYEEGTAIEGGVDACK